MPLKALDADEEGQLPDGMNRCNPAESVVEEAQIKRELDQERDHDNGKIKRIHSC